MTKPRTAGDGMESVEYVSETTKKAETPITNIKPKKENPLVGRLVQIYPTKIINSKRKNNQMYSKTPKFVPYEPYPAAVKPMGHTSHSQSNKKSKNHMDLNTLISQMSQMNTNITEFKPRTKLTSTSSKSASEDDKTCVEDEMQIKLDSLVKENENLKEQLKQQVQVKTVTKPI